MTEHNLFYYPYASFTNTQLPLLNNQRGQARYIVQPVARRLEQVDEPQHMNGATQRPVADRWKGNDQALDDGMNTGHTFARSNLRKYVV